MNDMTLRAPEHLDETNAVLQTHVVSIKSEADGVVSIELSLPNGGALPQWTPGAHIDVILPNGLIRQYSLCGDPASVTTYKIGVLNEPKSRGGSRYIHEHFKQGDQVTISLPRNNFALKEAEKYLFIAGGIGITPILPMLRQATQQGKDWTLLYGGRCLSSMAFLDEINALSGTKGAKIHIIPQDELGLPDLKKFLGVPCDKTVIYCCGPGPLIDAVEGHCQTWRAGALNRERFAAKEKPALEKGAFEVELARSGTRLLIPPYRSILDVLKENGHQVTHSCTAGICGTCLVKVLSGTPQHNDDLLSDADRAAGNVMLVCVSRSESDLLVLDL